MFVNFSRTLYEKRWFEVYNFVAAAIPMIKVLEQRWDARRYVDGFSRDKANPDRDSKFNPHAIAGVLGDPMFHSYNDFILSVGTMLKRLASWLEACPCHVQFVRGARKFRRRRVNWKGIFPEMDKPRCPMASCRAPELAAGALDVTLAEIADASSSDLISKFRPDLSAADKRVVLHDFGVARCYLELGISVKLSCWRILPWILAGFGHHREAVRSDIAKTSLQLYDDSIAAGYTDELHHACTVKFLSPTKKLRRHVQVLAATGRMHAELADQSSRLKFIPVAERALLGR